MLFINDEFYGRRRLERFWQTLEDDADFQAHLQQPLAVCLQDPAEWLMLVLYLRQRRLSVLPIDASMPRPQAEQLAQRAGCAHLLYGQRQTVIDIDIDQPAPEHSLLQLSSGTTGEVKVIARHWDDIDTEIRNYIGFFRQPENMTPVIACPVTHAYGLICGVLVALERESTPAIITRLQAGAVVKRLLKTHQPLVYASPFLLDGIVRLLPARVPLHAVMTSGSVLPVAVFERLRGRVSHFFQQYGCSEVGCISINEEVRDPAEIGRVLPHLQLAMTSAQHTAQEIVVLTADGRRVATRDLGLLDSQQRLTYLSRLDDTIVVAGKNVYPHEVETTVLACAGVTDAVAFAVDDALAGQRVALQVCVSNDIGIKEVERWCSQQLAPFQRPHHLQVVPRILRMATGKISRRQLSASLQTQINRQHGVLI
jgi:acyl-CoA synthetase (AMP-forming)/AMP-acid ligase II